MKITVLGTGYVGLVSGTCFAEFGFQVTCVDTDANKIQCLLDGNVPIYEAGLPEMIKRNRHGGRLHFSTDVTQALADADVIFLAVGTPTDPKTGHADLQYIEAAAREIAANTTRSLSIVIKSTVPIGTNRRLKAMLESINPSVSFDLISNPEFLREGQALEDFMRPDRVVVGTHTQQAQELMKRLYGPLTLRNIPIVFTDPESAELIKYAANSFLAMKIAFINQIADLSEKTGANIQDISYGLGLDQRIGSKFLQPGPGYGGSCFPKDTMALRATAHEIGIPLSLIDTVIDANDARKRSMAQRIIQACGGQIAGKKIAILGLTFKPETDDMRDSVGLDIIPALQAAGANVSAFDPKGIPEAQKLLKGIHYAQDAYECLEAAEALVILTEWNEFRALDMARVKTLLTHPLIIDLRNIYDPREMSQAGFTYHSIGRPSTSSKSLDALSLQQKRGAR